MTTTIPPSAYNWIRTLKPSLKKLDRIPLTGNAPPFPWDQLADRLARALDREGLAFQPGEIQWRAKEDLLEGLGDQPASLSFAIPSLKGQVCWVIPEQEMARLEALILTKESHPLTLQDSALSQSFYRFITLEVLYHLSQVSFDKNIAPILLQQATLPHEDSLCWDISLRLQEQSVWGRLIISPEFRRSWVEYFAQQENPSTLTQHLSQVLEVLVHVEAGQMNLSLKDWSNVKLGDFLILDTYSLDPQRLEGRVMLTINGQKAFRAKLKDGHLKILELPLFEEVETPMAKDPEDEDDLSDLDFSEEEQEEENPSEIEPESEIEIDEEELFEDEDLFAEESQIEEEENIQTETAESEPETEPETSEDESESQTQEPGLLTPQQIPVALTVEVGRIQMTIEQLLKLEPGNLLEIDIHPKNGVDLTINGKVVGKGELIRIGEALGVRVMQLGH